MKYNRRKPKTDHIHCNKPFSLLVSKQTTTCMLAYDKERVIYPNSISAFKYMLYVLFKRGGRIKMNIKGMACSGEEV